jgi:hypothetical protein
VAVPVDDPQQLGAAMADIGAWVHAAALGGHRALDGNLRMSFSIRMPSFTFAVVTTIDSEASRRPPASAACSQSVCTIAHD